MEDVYVVNTHARATEIHDSEPVREQEYNTDDANMNVSDAISTSRVRLLLRNLPLSEQVASYACTQHVCSVQVWLDVTLLDTRPCRSVCGVVQDILVHTFHHEHVDQSVRDDDREPTADSSTCTLVCDLPEFIQHIPEGQHTLSAQLVDENRVHLAVPTRVHFVMKYVNQSVLVPTDSESNLAAANQPLSDHVGVNAHHEKHSARGQEGRGETNHDTGRKEHQPSKRQPSKRQPSKRQPSKRGSRSHMEGVAHSSSKSDENHDMDTVAVAGRLDAVDAQAQPAVAGRLDAVDAQAQPAVAGRLDAVDAQAQPAVAAPSINYAATREYARCGGETHGGRNRGWDACVEKYVTMMNSLDRGASDMCGAKQGRPCMNAVVYR
jgi:hypothetical protein